MKIFTNSISMSGYKLALLILLTASASIGTVKMDWRMLFGSAGDQYDRLWVEFCDELKLAGSAIEFYSPDDNELDRAEGYRFLTRTLRLSLLSELEHFDAARPVIWQSETPTRKFGGNNPDEIYYDAYIDGTRSYRITGQRGTTPLIELTVYEGRMRSGERGKHVAHLTEQDLVVGEDGAVEIILSPNHHEGNWIKTTEATNFLFIRQYRFDWAQDVPADLSIEPMIAPNSPAELRLSHVRQRLMAVARAVEHNASYWPKLTKLASLRASNTVMDPITPGAEDAPSETEDTTLPQGHILQPGYFDLDDNEALLIRFTPPSGLSYWGFSLLNRWFESLDYRYQNVHSNHLRAQVGEQGAVTLVVAHRDPGLPNWIDTTGHRQGMMLFRWTRPTPATVLPDVTVEKVALDRLPGRLGGA
ncbi:MAG: DUF1214 domain-containing protein [Halieaceae bacterium]|nr:DUF1214 domain-containing protein [Halieaceae bacterium]